MIKNKPTYTWLVRYRLFSKWGRMMLKEAERNHWGVVDLVEVLLDPKACANIVHHVSDCGIDDQWEVRIIDDNLGEWYTLEICDTRGEATRFCKRMRIPVRQYLPLK